MTFENIWYIVQNKQLDISKIANQIQGNISSYNIYVPLHNQVDVVVMHPPNILAFENIWFMVQKKRLDVSKTTHKIPGSRQQLQH